MTTMQVSSFIFIIVLVCSGTAVNSFRPWPLKGNNGSSNAFGVSKANEGSSSFVQLHYHMGPVLTSSIRVYIIWYGQWKTSQKNVIKDFFRSISTTVNGPSVQTWWSTVRLYTDQTGANISGSLVVAGERTDMYSQGRMLSRMTVQEVIKYSLLPYNGSLPVDPRGGVYMVLTSENVIQQDFCSAVCGFHYFTYSSIVGYTLPYAWIGNSGNQCPETCAYPFAIPSYMGNAVKAFKAPNGDIGVDGMISVIGHELAEMSSNPLINAWYAGSDPTAPTEVADLCEGMYGTGAGGSYTGLVLKDRFGASYNMRGIGERRFLVQWVWSPVLNACTGPNAIKSG
eukprot:c18628_g1_i1 orf=426-1445(-)